MCVCMPGVYLVPREERKACWFPCNGSYRWLWAATWFLGIEPMSGKAAGDLNCWTISPTPATHSFMYSILKINSNNKHMTKDKHFLTPFGQNRGQVWGWFMPGILAVGRLKQKIWIKANLGYIASSRPTGATNWNLISTKKQSKTGHLGFYKWRFSTTAKWIDINLDT